MRRDGNFEITERKSSSRRFKNTKEENLYNKQILELMGLQARLGNRVNSFNIDNNLDIISQAMHTINTQLSAIETYANQYERTLYEKYVEGFEDELANVKNAKEDELLAKIDELEKLNKELLIKSNSYINSIELLEARLSKVENENRKYIEELKEKESEIANLNDYHQINVDSIKRGYKGHLAKLREGLENSEKNYNDQISDLNRDKEILQVKISNLQDFVKELQLDKESLKNEVSKAQDKVLEMGVKLAKLEAISEINEIDNVDSTESNGEYVAF